MGRIELTTLPSRTGYEIIVGWDRPLATYFANVRPPEQDEDDPDGGEVVWIGTSVGEITSPDAIIEAVKPYAEIPPRLRAQLAEGFLNERVRPGQESLLPVLILEAMEPFRSNPQRR